MQPLESVSPIILNPHLNPKKPVPIELLNKVNDEFSFPTSTFAVPHAMPRLVLHHAMPCFAYGTEC